MNPPALAGGVFNFPGRLPLSGSSGKTNRRRTEENLQYAAYFCMLFIQIPGKCLNAGQKYAARQERPGTVPVPAGQYSSQGNGTQFAFVLNRGLLKAPPHEKNLNQTPKFPDRRLPRRSTPAGGRAPAESSTAVFPASSPP